MLEITFNKQFFSHEQVWKKCIFPGKISQYFLCISLLKNTKFPTKWSHFPGRSFLISTVRPQHSVLMSLRADFICSWKHIHAKSRRTVDIKMVRDFHHFL